MPWHVAIVRVRAGHAARGGRGHAARRSLGGQPIVRARHRLQLKEVGYRLGQMRRGTLGGTDATYRYYKRQLYNYARSDLMHVSIRCGHACLPNSTPMYALLARNRR